MKCGICNRDGLSPKELEVHNKYYHQGRALVTANGQNSPRKVVDGGCPECGGSSLRRDEGCVTCLDCSWTRCG